MKKITLWLLILPMLFFMSGCSKEENKGTPTPNNNEEIIDTENTIVSSKYQLPVSCTWAENLPIDKLIAINSEEELKQYIKGSTDFNIDFSTQSLYFLQLQEIYEIDSVKTNFEKSTESLYSFSAQVYVNPWKSSLGKSFKNAWIIEKTYSNAIDNYNMIFVANNKKREDTCACGLREKIGNIDLAVVTFYKDPPENEPIWWKENCIVYYTISNTAYAYYGMNRDHICNFPQEAKSWNVPLTGIKVSFTAEAYYSNDDGAHTADHRVFDLILTSLKKKE